jgi:hypothetical protein
MDKIVINLDEGVRLSQEQSQIKEVSRNSVSECRGGHSHNITTGSPLNTANLMPHLESLHIFESTHPFDRFKANHSKLTRLDIMVDNLDSADHPSRVLQHHLIDYPTNHD